MPARNAVRRAFDATDLRALARAVERDAPEPVRDAAVRVHALLDQRDDEPYLTALVRALGGRATDREIQRVGLYRGPNSVHSSLSRAVKDGHLRRIAIGVYALPEVSRG